MEEWKNGRMGEWENGRMGENEYKTAKQKKQKIWDQFLH
jgi:hypothetical protein